MSSILLQEKSRPQENQKRDIQIELLKNWKP